MKPAMKTTIANTGISCDSAVDVDKTPAMPARELTRMKQAAVPEMTLVGAQCMSRIRGLKKMPPPTPVMPERNPRIAPVVMSEVIEGDLVWSSVAVLAVLNMLQAAYSKNSPIVGL
jgi:hypothetical protein